MKKQTWVLIIAAGLTVLFWSCKSGDNKEGTESPATSPTEEPSKGGQSAVNDDVSQPNVVKVAISSKDHTTLVKAVQAAELVDALSNNGPFTVFAPTNAAFDELPKGALDDLMKPEKKDALQNVLYNHVIVGVYKPESFKDGQVVTMFGGNKVTMGVKDGKVTVNGANILATVPASNGVVLVVDKVLLAGK